MTLDLILYKYLLNLLIEIHVWKRKAAHVHIHICYTKYYNYC